MANQLPILDAEARLSALAKSAEVRHRRAVLKGEMKAGRLGMAEALEHEDLQRVRVRDIIASMPGVGASRTADAMERLKIKPGLRVARAGARQRAALIAWADSVVDGAGVKVKEVA